MSQVQAALNLPVTLTGAALRPVIGRLPESTRTLIVGATTSALYMAGAYAAAMIVSTLAEQRRRRYFR